MSKEGIRSPELYECGESRDLEKIVGDHVEEGDQGPPEVESSSAHVCFEGKRYGGEHHGEDDQCQADNAQDQVDFHQLAGQRALAKTAGQAAHDSFAFQHGQ